jgi:hypothetical protein
MPLASPRTFVPPYLLGSVSAEQFPGDLSALATLEGPVQPTARQYFSLALGLTLGEADRAQFGLVLSVQESAGLMAELDRLRFAEWRVENRTIGDVVLHTFDVNFQTNTPSTPVSVIIPSYNNTREELHRSISSALRALSTAGILSLSEILVIDDASGTPATQSLAEFSDHIRANRLRAIRLDRNRGVARARNRALALARHPRVVFLDADDEMHPGYLRAALRQFESGAEVVASDMAIAGVNELICGRAGGVPDVYVDNSFGSGIAIDLECKTISRLRRLQPLYNPLFWVCYEDWELNCVLWQMRAAIAILPVPFYRYYRKSVGRDAKARDLHPYFKWLLPYSAKARAWVASTL